MQLPMNLTMCDGCSTRMPAETHVLLYGLADQQGGTVKQAENKQPCMSSRLPGTSCLQTSAFIHSGMYPWNTDVQHLKLGVLVVRLQIPSRCGLSSSYKVVTKHGDKLRRLTFARHDKHGLSTVALTPGTPTSSTSNWECSPKSRTMSSAYISNKMGYDV